MKALNLNRLALLASVLGLIISIPVLSGCSRFGAVNTDLATLSNTTVEATETLNNLQTAYDGESNAHARYLAFAQKADAEGYGRVASLFRAAARAEEIHASNHARVIQKLGGAPTANIKTPEVNGTAENLDAAIKGESYERDTMYPDFLKQAREVANSQAVRTFNLARNAEAEHAKLYSEARNNLEAWKTDKQIFFVCPVCGFTTSNLNFERCPSSFTSREKFVPVS
ncbi:MAG TPA: rubrerythrin family protein [Pyrinomonadaceae bacterium]|nr:rubrerythrin family protein [Pyrinomonadaceae bacterium]